MKLSLKQLKAIFARAGRKAVRYLPRNIQATVRTDVPKYSGTWLSQLPERAARQGNVSGKWEAATNAEDAIQFVNKLVKKEKFNGTALFNSSFSGRKRAYKNKPYSEKLLEGLFGAADEGAKEFDNNVAVEATKSGIKALPKSHVEATSKGGTTKASKEAFILRVNSISVPMMKKIIGIASKVTGNNNKKMYKSFRELPQGIIFGEGNKLSNLTKKKNPIGGLKEITVGDDAKFPAGGIMKPSSGNSKIFLNQTKITDARLNSKGWRGATYESPDAMQQNIAVHEFGHGVDFINTGARLSQNLQKRYPLTVVSKYGTTNPQEFFAEAYSLWATPAGRKMIYRENPRLARTMEDVFKAKSAEEFNQIADRLAREVRVRKAIAGVGVGGTAAGVAAYKKKRSKRS